MRLISHLTLLLLLAATLSCACPDPVAGSPFVFGVTRTIDSEILGESRTLNIYLPKSYGSSRSDRYPVIVLLDGGADEDFHHVTGLVQFLTAYELMPESIVVGVGNVDRQRDFVHLSEVEEERGWYPNHGQSVRFRRFLNDELLPWVDASYRAGDHRLLIGQSAAGLFAVEHFLQQPDSFDAYFIVSPSLYWNRESLARSAPEALASHSGTRWLYLAIGSEGKVMQSGYDRLVRALEEHAPPGLDWQDERFPDETHATILHRALYRGFEQLYGDEWPGL